MTIMGWWCSLLIGVCLTVLSATPAKTAVEAWVQRYSHLLDSFDSARQVVADREGNVIVAGTSDDGTGFDKIVIIKYSGAGGPLWTNRYMPGGVDDAPNAMAVDKDGNVFVTAGSNNGYAYATVAYSGAGVPLWTNRYQPEYRATPYAISADGAGNVFVTGEADSGYTTVAYSTSGIPLWTNHYNSPWHNSPGWRDRATALSVNRNGDVVVTGYSYVHGQFVSEYSHDYVTIAYSAAGIPLWTNRYGGAAESYDDRATAIVADDTGNVYVTGQSWNGHAYDYATVAYSSAGVPLWTNRYDGPQSLNDYPYGIAAGHHGTVVVTGQSYDGSNPDYATVAYSASGVAVWTNRYDGPGDSIDDRATAVAVAPSGDVIVTGQSHGDSTALDFATIKYSAAGVPLWTNRYDGPTDSIDYEPAIALNHTGNVFIAGSSRHPSRSSPDFVTIAYSETGTSMWTNLYDGFSTNDTDQATAVLVDRSGHVFVTGLSINNAGGGRHSDYVTIAYTQAGMPLWTNRYNGGGRDEAMAMALGRNDTVLVTGLSVDAGSSSYDYVTVAYTIAGLPLWTNRYNGPGNLYSRDDIARAMAVDQSGNVFVTGDSASTSIGSLTDYATVAYSAAGVPLWTNRYNGPENWRDVASAVAVDDRGNVYVTGAQTYHRPSFEFNHTDYGTIAYTGGGVPLWTNRYNVDNHPFTSHSATGVAVDRNGNVFVTGTSDVSATGPPVYADYATVAYTDAGVPLWTNRYNGPANNGDFARAVAVDHSGNVIVTGASMGNGSSYDYATVAYSNSGVPLWTNRYSELGDDQPAGLTVDESGNVYVTGQGNTGSRTHFATVAYSAHGIPLWTNRYEAPGSTANGAADVAVDRYGSVYVTGYSRASGAATDDIITIKYSTGRTHLTITPTGNDCLLRVNGLPGTAYRLERATSLHSTWQTIATGTIAESGRTEFQDTSPPPGQAFYRAQAE